ncbi:hypothetical protein pdam_00024079 [Pocillopora damicornis]|uniref:Uncharacterized protein n=1 Tax=Pocillopora damicornis TaxID=46731 RepID=A0A3M6U609_POCDA|nr:hypothetical protein pdam_00024079 [Pocillopora damicornis]
MFTFKFSRGRGPRNEPTLLTEKKDPVDLKWQLKIAINVSDQEKSSLTFIQKIETKFDEEIKTAFENLADSALIADLKSSDKESNNESSHGSDIDIQEECQGQKLSVILIAGLLGMITSKLVLEVFLSRAVPWTEQKKRLSKVPNIEVSDLFKDYDFHLVQLLDTSLIKMNALS